MTAQRRTALASVLCALVGFALTSTGLRALVPWPAEFGMRAKWEHFAAHKDDYDTLLLGTSFTQYGLDPRALDEALGRRGLPQRSFNFALAGMNAYELDHLLREVLALRPAGLKHVFVEAIAWTAPPDIWVEGEFLARAVHWHTPARTLDVISTVVRETPDRRAALRQSLVHLRLMGQRLVNHAQGPRVLAALAGSDDPRAYLTPHDLEAGQGWRALAVDDGEEFRERHERFRAHLGEYGARVRTIEAGNARRAGTRHKNPGALAAQNALLASTGAQVVWFVPPADSDGSELYATAERGGYPNLVGFNWPSRFPTLYQPMHRFDRGHLNAPGAAEWARLFAAEVAPLLAGGPGPRGN